ncbi:ArnT family glycosyltransferase [Sorangium sp. So ce861]|uniref:ArnT family glycosyltransferase n=1 Tax=Sorangium sp. So ce861 TaxID=3133323 RepID=UPI003F5E20FA
MNDTHDKSSGAPADARDGTTAADETTEGGVEGSGAAEPRAVAPEDEAAARDGAAGADEAAARDGAAGADEAAARDGAAGADEAAARDGAAGADDAAPDTDEVRLVPQGNPLRWRGAAVSAAGALLAFVVMALAPQLRWGVPLGALGIAVATLGLLELLGTFHDPPERVAARVGIRDLRGPLALLGSGLAAFFVLVTLAVAGYLSPSSISRGGAPTLLSLAVPAVAVPAAFLTAVVGAFRLGERLGPFRVDETGAPRPLIRRHGFWLVALVTLLYLPMLGSHSLTDPWETHYGEVAREILARNDWISLWWAQDGWFWSKPVLDFWMQALAMATFGVRYRSGEMLSAVAEGRTPWPEWAVRLPIFALTLVAVYLLYKAISRIFSRRAGLLAGVVLTTMPQWFMVSHQTMTDMPFVATMAAAMALLLLGIHTDDAEEARVYEVDLGPLKVGLSLYHLVLGAIVACALPQVLYLLSRHVEIHAAPFGLRLHGDVFSSGSPGNCGLPGNEACRPALPVLPGLQPALQAIIWAQALGIVLYASWGERRVQRLLFLAAWFFAALSTMAKGPAGFGLPVLCALGYVVVSRRYRDLLKLEIPVGLLVLACVALPWFVAMYARHGQPFTDRLLFHDMFKRAFTHVHDTNEGDDVSFRYYVWQLGYAMFPWTGLVPASLVWWLRRREGGAPGEPGSAEVRKSDASVFLAMWFLFGFALFSLMLTKFHHYILPAVPPAAMLTGILLDDMLRLEARAGALGPGAASATAPPSRALATVVYERAMLGAVAIGAALLVFFVGRDLAMAREGQPSQARLLHLFTYNYKRPWPQSLDFSATLWAFTAAAALLCLLLVVARIRRLTLYALAALAIAFTAWGLDVYFVRTSPHWGQRETLLAYARASQEIPGPLVAYQMNWKGENFYAGNELAAFVSSGKKFQDYINEQKKKGVKTFYFVTEHGRINSLSNELGNPRIFERLTSIELNNKFLVVRATFE